MMGRVVDAKTAMAHGFTSLSVVAGVIGFGLIYNGLAQSNRTDLTIGVPLLLLGLWWAGKELGRSNLAAKRRRMLKGR